MIVNKFSFIENSFVRQTNFCLMGVHLVFLVSIFALPLVGSPTIFKFFATIFYFILYYISSSLRDKKISISYGGDDFNRYTILTFGLLLFLGFYNSFVKFDFKNAVINTVLLSNVFLFTLVRFAEPMATFERVRNVFIGYTFISAVLSVFEYYWYSSLPLVSGYVNLASTLSEFSNLATDIFDPETGTLRPFGLFQDHMVNSFVFGVAATFLFSRYFFGKDYNKSHQLVLVIALAILVFLTKSRNGILIFFLGLLTVYLFRFSLFKRFAVRNLTLLSVIPLAIYFLIMWSAILYVDLGNGELDTIGSRVHTWLYVLNVYVIDSDFTDVLFGYGVSTVRDELSDTDLWALDNTLVQTYMYCGIVGVTAFFCWLFWLGKQLLRMAADGSDENLIAIYAIYIQYLTIGALNATLQTMPIVPIVLIFSFSAFQLFEAKNSMRKNIY